MWDLCQMGIPTVEDKARRNTGAVLLPVLGADYLELQQISMVL